MKSWSWGTLTLVVVLVGVWLATEWAGGSTSAAVLSDFGMRRALWGFSESPDRLVRSLFLHFGFWHLAFNLLGLWVLGPLVERRSGHLGLWWLFLVCGLAGALGSLTFNPQSASLGASGGIYGLAGCLLIALVRSPGDLDASTRRAWLIWLTVALVVGLGPGMSSVHVDRWAHIAGALAGLCLGPTLDWGRSRWWRLHPLGTAVAAVGLAGLFFKLDHGPRLPNF